GVVDPLSGLEDKGTVLQIIIDNDDGHQAYVFFRWGRVGAKNPQVKRAPFPINQTLHVILLQRKLHGPFTKDAAKELFVSKFTAKTENDWPVTPPFEPVKGKYTLIELDYSEGDDNSTTMMDAETAKNNPEQGAAEVVPPSTLPVSVQTFVKVSKLSKSHLAKGYVILDFISDTLTTIADLNAASKQVEATSSTPRHRRRSSRVIKSTASSTTKAQLAKCKAQLKDWTSEYIKLTHAPTHRQYKLHVDAVHALHKLEPSDSIDEKDPSLLFDALNNHQGVLILSDVALGTPVHVLDAQEYSFEALQKLKCHSLLGVGRMAPSEATHETSYEFALKSVRLRYAVTVTFEFN
ncbi:hypothetical protein DYB28_003314, partial [Aphanomyces astaci]